MRQTLSFTEVHEINMMTKRELCHWLRSYGGVIHTAYPLDMLPKSELVSMVCDAKREAGTDVEA